MRFDTVSGIVRLWHAGKSAKWRASFCERVNCRIMRLLVEVRKSLYHCVSHREVFMQTCSLCDSPIRARGLCIMHWKRWRRYGDASITPKQVNFDKSVNIFLSHIDKTGDCWVWTGCLNAYGYGVTRINGKLYTAHRFSWFMTHGPIPDGLCILHKCDNPPCVNPSHLFIGTKADNMWDKSFKGRHHYQTINCKRGHKFDIPPTPGVKRNCTICAKERYEFKRHMKEYMPQTSQLHTLPESQKTD
jgi:hypothetical protein